MHRVGALTDCLATDLLITSLTLIETFDLDLISWFEVVCRLTEPPTQDYRAIHSVATGVAAILASQVLLCPAATTPGKPPT